MPENIKPQKSRLRLNIIDFLLIIAVLGALIGIAVRAGVVERVTNQANLETAKVSFLIQDIQESSADYFGIGDEFRSLTHNCVFGKLESRQFMPAEAFIADSRGTLIKTHSANNRIDVRGVISCSGTFTDEGFLLAGTSFIAPNSGIRIQSPSIDVYITVIDIAKE